MAAGSGRGGIDATDQDVLMRNLTNFCQIRFRVSVIGFWLRCEWHYDVQTFVNHGFARTIILRVGGGDSRNRWLTPISEHATYQQVVDPHICPP
tara:strand:+ start:1365 stop:1646 length:282 start_codon:yes stop_codon:yes gene_type:complete